MIFINAFIVLSMITAIIASPQPHYGKITVPSKLICRKNSFDYFRWLHLRCFNQCINILSDYPLPACIFQQFHQSNVTYLAKDLQYLLLNDTNKISCDTFMVFSENMTLITELFKNKQKRLRPFMYFYLFMPDELIIPNESIIAAMTYGYNIYKVHNNIYDKMPFYFNSNFYMISNLFTNKTFNTLERDLDKAKQYFGTTLSHPLFTEGITKSKPFRMATFNCPPHFIILDKKKLK